MSMVSISKNLTIFASIVFSVILFPLNFLFNVDINAQDQSQIINIQNLLKVHNIEREKNNLPKFLLNQKLNNSAQMKADTMIKTNCWSHYCPEGVEPWRFFEQADYPYVLAGENLAEGFFSSIDVMQAWMNSRTHRENVLKEKFQEIGFGIAYGNYQNKSNNILVVVHFGSRGDNSITNFDNFFISTPRNNQAFYSTPIDVVGQIPTDLNFQSIRIYNNNIDQGSGRIEGGVFTFKIENLKTGINTLYAQGVLDSGLVANTPVVQFEYAPNLNNLETFRDQFSSNSGIFISKDVKQSINLFFLISFLGVILFNFTITRNTNIIESEVQSTKIRSSKKDLNYNLAIFIIMIVIFLIGGISGRIMI